MEAPNDVYHSGLSATLPKYDPCKLILLPEGTTLVPSDLVRNIQLTNEGIHKQLTGSDHSVAGSKDQVDKTQSTQFEESVTDQNKGKTSSKVEPVINPPVITSLGDFQPLLKDSKEELKGFRDEEILDTRELMDSDIPKDTKDSSQPPP
ncbi:hypothetical protein Tco_0421368 [Tanacetum coccineum]